MQPLTKPRICWGRPKLEQKFFDHSRIRNRKKKNIYIYIYKIKIKKLKDTNRCLIYQNGIRHYFILLNLSIFNSVWNFVTIFLLIYKIEESVKISFFI